MEPPAKKMRKSGAKTITAYKKVASFDIAANIFHQTNLKPGSSSVSSSKHTFSRKQDSSSIDSGNPRTGSKHRNTQSSLKKPQTHGTTTQPTRKQCKLPSRVERVVNALEDPLHHLFCIFLHENLPVFDTANTLLQREEPCIHILRQTLLQQLRVLLNRFIKPSSLLKYKDDLHELPYQRVKHQKDNDELFIGNETRKFLKERPHIDKAQFYDNVRKFYCRAVEYMLQKFPYTDPVLVHAEVAQVGKRAEAKFTSIQFFADRFTCLGLNSSEKLNCIQQEFIQYQIDDLTDEILTSCKADRQWFLIGQLKDTSMNIKYELLPKLMIAILVMFHSNADCERIFSFVTKTKTAHRSSMSIETLSDLLVQKQYMLANGVKCHEANQSDALLRQCKSATYMGMKTAQQ